MSTGMLGFDARRPPGVPIVGVFRKAAADAVVINKHDPVALTAAGYIARAGAASTAIMGFAAHDEVPGGTLSSAFARMPAIKVDDGTGTLVPEIRVILALPETIFTAQAGTAPAATDVGAAHDIVAVGSTGWRVDLTAAVTGICQVKGIYPGEEGVANGRVDIVIPPAKSQATTVAV